MLASIKSEKQCTQSYLDLGKKCHLICSVGQLADQKASKPTCLPEFVWRPCSYREQVNKAKLNYHRSQTFGGTFSHIFTFFCFNFVGLFDAGGQSQNTVTLHRFMLGIYCLTVSRSCTGKRVLPNPRHKRLRHINNLCKRKLGTIMFPVQSRYFLWPLHQSRYSSNLQALF